MRLDLSHFHVLPLIASHAWTSCHRAEDLIGFGGREIACPKCLNHNLSLCTFRQYNEDGYNPILLDSPNPLPKWVLDYLYSKMIIFPETINGSLLRDTIVGRVEFLVCWPKSIFVDSKEYPTIMMSLMTKQYPIFDINGNHIADWTEKYAYRHMDPYDILAAPIIPQI